MKKKKQTEKPGWWSDTCLTKYNSVWVFWPCPVWLLKFPHDFFLWGFWPVHGNATRLPHSFESNSLLAASPLFSDVVLVTGPGFPSPTTGPDWSPRVNQPLLRHPLGFTKCGKLQSCARGSRGGSIQNQRLVWIHSNLGGFWNPYAWSTVPSTGL